MEELGRCTGLTTHFCCESNLALKLKARGWRDSLEAGSTCYTIVRARVWMLETYIASHANNFSCLMEQVHLEMQRV